jgi:hypothetical protein
VYASSSAASSLRPALLHADNVVTVRSADLQSDSAEIAAHEQSVSFNESSDGDANSQPAGE